ncbi:MAG: hypothetical protein MHM6MM_005915, partial [Cercozoa sp. M6MM]
MVVPTRTAVDKDPLALYIDYLETDHNTVDVREDRICSVIVRAAVSRFDYSACPRALRAADERFRATLRVHRPDDASTETDFRATLVQQHLCEVFAQEDHPLARLLKAFRNLYEAQFSVPTATRHAMQSQLLQLASDEEHRQMDELNNIQLEKSAGPTPRRETRKERKQKIRAAEQLQACVDALQNSCFEASRCTRLFVRRVVSIV